MKQMHCLFLLLTLCFDDTHHSEGGSHWGNPHSDTAEVDDESEVVGESSTNTLIDKVFRAAKIVGLQPPMSDPTPVGGVWEGISRINSPPCIPVADNYLSMLRTAWKKPSQKPQFNAGCRRLANTHYPVETGLGDMPPVEQAMASWTALGPARVSANPRCPRKECAKTDCLISRSFNAVARAARMGNALAILLVALRKTMSIEDQDSKTLIESALSAHSQLTGDMGETMSSAILWRRQVWLAQTSLPDAIKAELMNLPVMPGQVFHPGSQEVLEGAEQSITLRETIQRACRKPAPAFKQGIRPPPKPQQSGRPRHGGRAQEQDFRTHDLSSAVNPQRRPQHRGTGQQKTSSRGADRGGGLA